MNTATSTLQHYRQMAANQTTATHDWHNRRQLHAVMQVQELPLPDLRSESWRYTPLPPLLEQQFKPAEPEEDLLFAEDIRQLRLTGDDSPRIVLLNGFFVQELSSLPEDGPLSVQPLRSALANGNKAVFEHLGELSGEGAHLFTALNTASLGEGVFIRVAAGAVLEQPVEILHVTISFDNEYITQPRLLVLLEEGAQATLIEHYTHLADTLCLNNIVAEVFLEKGAQLHHPRLQNESLRTRHLYSLYVRQAENSQYHGTTLALGGAWSRTEFHVDFSGSDADCQLNGFYLAGGKQSHDMHLDVIHNQPGCTSRERFKGILFDHGKAVFDGNVEVRPDAQKTDARLSNDNLLLSRDAEIDTKPRLEIYADDVLCSHGTTVGQIDDEMLFYLRSRGIVREQAVNMICTGFADEIIAMCQWEALENRAREAVSRIIQNSV
ncbi:MAG: Fe-S cluster assembly protein SufD [Gammaproteobacteria bacterium]|nr:Fe-S cluster assembly protein SufD [Gammaproteobacteria bacterium]MBU1723331.1 Fe-S cluster assembly protein SufD [Gammaproteobacteria bacterium]MBU2006626.1 Fe-S cluster assembly protein SufD [Gammaproteobacteria bacterium]